MSRFLGKFSEDEGATTVSVGSAMRDGAVYNHNHPAYQKLADLVTAEVSHLAARDSEKRSRAVPAVLTVVVSSAEREELVRSYPELRLIDYGMDRPGHAYLAASIAMANEYLLYSAEKVASSAVHLGGSLMSALMKRDFDVHLEMDPSVAAAVHGRNRDTCNTARVMGDYARLIADAGDVPARRNYEAYLRKTAYSMCTRSANCVAQAEVFLADLATYSMSPAQFCAAMRQCDADVGYGFFIYHPIMLMSDAGELPGTGVYFEKAGGRLYFKYPHGVTGVESYSLVEWASWLSEHVIRVGKGAAESTYHMQLTKTRGPFMFFSSTRVPNGNTHMRVRHALDLVQGAKQYVVTSWTLKDLVRDPSLPSSWERTVFMAPTKVVDDLFSFGLQLSKENFTRHAMRKRLQVMDRVTLEGTSIAFGFRPTRGQEDALVTAIHARVFVERYRSGNLVQHLMERLKLVASFGSASTAQKISAVAMWSLRYAWDYTFGAFGEAIGAMCDWLEKWFSRGRPALPTVTLAPDYVSFETIVGEWRSRNRTQLVDAGQTLAGFEVLAGASNLKGAAITTALAQFNSVTSTVVNQVARKVSDVYAGSYVGLQAHVQTDESDRVTVDPTELDDVRRDLEEALCTELQALNVMDEAPIDRNFNPTETAVRVPSMTKDMKPDFSYDAGYIATMNDVYHEFNPEVAHAPLEQDIASISQQDQDRNLAADFLKLPRLMDMAPKDRAYYMSKIRALGAPKRQETQQELLSSVGARNLAAPVVSLPQHPMIIREIWENFLDTMCVDGARDKIRSFIRDPVGLEKGAYESWMSKARPDVINRVLDTLREQSRALEEMDVGQYIMMLKADVKPPLSDKPVRSRIEPQVIVYHEKAMSSLYSSVYRVLVDRFLSLLKPNVHVNLRKSTEDIADFIRTMHPFGEKGLKYLENDFSKFDKSQNEFVFALETYVFQQLGMNQAMLDRWFKGHADCSVRSFVTGLSVNVRFQRKSGDATTAFGNVLLNIMSVAYAYGISDFAWGVFMGDDSLVACRSIGHTNSAVDTLAEVFNLTAKMYITDAPYCFSNFVVIDEDNRHLALVPDPIKWVEKRSQPVAADDPQWMERYISAMDTGQPFLYKANTLRLGKLVAQRYNVKRESADRLSDAIATALGSFDKYRACYEPEPEVIRY